MSNESVILPFLDSYTFVFGLFSFVMYIWYPFNSVKPNTNESKEVESKYKYSVGFVLPTDYKIELTNINVMYLQDSML